MQGLFEFLVWQGSVERCPQNTTVSNDMSKPIVELQCGNVLGQPFPTTCVSIFKNCSEIAIFCVSMVLRSLPGPKCASIAKTEGKLRLLRLAGFAMMLLHLNAVKNCVIAILLVLAQPRTASQLSRCGEIAVLQLLAELFCTKCASAVGKHVCLRKNVRM